MSEEIISLKEIYNEDWSSAYRACNEWISNILVKPEHIDLVSGVALISYEGDQCFEELSIENQLAEEVVIEINNGSGKFGGSIRSEKDSSLTVKVKENIFIGASTENISRLVLESEGGVYLGEIKHGRTLSIESNNLVAFGVSYAADFRVKTNDLINIYGGWHTQNNNIGHIFGENSVYIKAGELQNFKQINPIFDDSGHWRFGSKKFCDQYWSYVKKPGYAAWKELKEFCYWYSPEKDPF